MIMTYYGRVLTNAVSSIDPPHPNFILFHQLKMLMRRMIIKKEMVGITRGLIGNKTVIN